MSHKSFSAIIIVFRMDKKGQKDPTGFLLQQKINEVKILKTGQKNPSGVWVLKPNFNNWRIPINKFIQFNSDEIKSLRRIGLLDKNNSDSVDYF
ncbi:hypothetical protein BpHYR1_047228 [Brachionus plicatilis]|uniref:Uncharacterized protein n=1 Tax=Brachionus plicatilis TaxID=10195 RepID=A0A3M7T5J2_BRAPC|nr:hypothetical protein BpHYR1_047228 [Brachionus plicatilis]